MSIRIEEERLNALHQLDLLDTPSSEAFDRITRMAAQLFNLPIAAVSLTDRDRQWFKSRVGVDHCFIPRQNAPCSQVAESSECVVLPDLLADICYRDSTLAKSGIRFYAGAPLTTRDGFCLGAMCVLGSEPREVSDAEIGALSDLAAMVMAQIELQHAFGRVDPQSGFSNRNQFIEDMTDLAQDCQNDKQRILVIFDIASAEQLNSATRVMSSSYIDDLIRQVSQEIRASIGIKRKIYHVAATQFAILAAPGSELISYATLLADKMNIIGAKSDSYIISGLTCGIAYYDLEILSPLDALRIAHSAVQDARLAGARIGIYSSAQDATHKRQFQLLQDFPNALGSADQLKLVYQPRIDLVSNLCIGAEALLRWTHPNLGQVSPGEFVPIIEQTSMGLAMTEWVLEAALQQLAEWRSKGINIQLSVNVSASNLSQRDFAEKTQKVLKRHGLPSGCLELEVTESGVMQNAAQGISILQAISDAGISIAIDDFGTGYSSLSYLERMPAQVVKIDRSFTENLVSDHRKRALVKSIISISHDLGYRVVVEGIEDETVLDLVRAAGCDEVQGYLFSRPLISNKFLEWFLKDQTNTK